MKPITYWIQNEAIDQLVEKCGEYLQKLTPTARRDTIAFLASEANHWAWETTDQYGITPLLKSLTRHEKDKLIEAIAASLVHSGNPWLEAACKMSELEKAHKKEGTPLSIGMPTTADIDES